MFIHRGESFGSNGSSSNKKTKVPDIIIREDEAAYAPLPCIQVTQVVENSEYEYDFLHSPSMMAARRISEGNIGDLSSAPGSPRSLSARAPGRTSRRVSLIPGEALEQAHAALDRVQQQCRRGSTQLPTFLPLRKEGSTNSLSSSDGNYSSRPYYALRQDTSEQHELPKEKFRGPNDDILEKESRPEKIGKLGASTSLSSPQRIKSNQRWLKLRTTVQLSGALSSSMNRAKAPLKREDSFIKRFSTRQIAEVHDDTVDHTDEEEVNKSTTGSSKQRRKKRRREGLTVINPYGNLYFYWLFLITMCVMYNFWTAIVRQAFPELQSRNQILWYILDGCTDLTYIVDILLELRTGYLEQGMIVYDFKKLANHYLRSRNFLLDLVSIFPLDIIQLLIGANPIVRFPRFVKVYKVINYYYMVESRTLYPNLWRVFNLVHILLLLAHWFGCFYYMLSEAEQFRGDWTYPYTYGSEFKTLSRKYLGSVYWSTLTLTTIGDLPTPESNTHLRKPWRYKENSEYILPEIETFNDTVIGYSNDTKNAMDEENSTFSGTTTLPLYLQLTIAPFINPGTNQSHASDLDHSLMRKKQLKAAKTSNLNKLTPTNNEDSSSGSASYLGDVAQRQQRFLRSIPYNSSRHTWHRKYFYPGRPSFEKYPYKVNYTLVPIRRGPNGKGRGYKSRLLQLHTNGGYIFTITSYLIGVFVFATIVGQVGNVITNRNANRLEFERLLDGAKLYMRHHKVPREMQRRVQRWYDYSWSRGRIQGGGDINSALGLLPDKLRTELALHVNLCTLKKVSIFKECQPEFLHDLVLKIKAYIFTPGDLICRKGEVAREMFIIADGILEVISETGRVLTKMKSGDFFGEIGILNLDGLNKRTADVRSVGYSELFSLSRENVLAAMKDYPEAQEILQSLGRKRLMEARHHSKSNSTSSSKRSSLSPTRDLNPDQVGQAKKIVSRLRSDVSSIRNAFKRSKAMTRDLETLELEPLTNDGKIDDDNSSVKRILKKLGKTATSSGHSDSSSSTVRGVLKRMSRVTSDEAQNSQSPPNNGKDQGVLGAGLPLLQRLKLLRQKEEAEERKRQDEGKIRQKEKQHDVSFPNADTESNQDVIGEGLPLFARLTLLKAKEEKDRQRQVELVKSVEENDSKCIRQGSKTSSEELPPSLHTNSSHSSSRGSSISSPQKIKTVIKENVTKPSFKSKLKSIMQQPKDPPLESDLDSIGDKIINDLNKGTTKLGEGKNRTPRVENYGGNSNAMLDNVQSRIPVNNVTNLPCSALTGGISQSDSFPTDGDMLKDKLKRSDSFRKAMGDDSIANKEDYNISHSDEVQGTKSSQSKMRPTSSRQEQVNLNKMQDSKLMEKHLTADNQTRIPKPPRVIKMISKKVNSNPDESTKNSNTTLKVPSKEVSPPLSSPESTETPERKSLKSILKQMSREDSAINLLPIDGADLKRLMMSPTVQGFVARRSKLAKSVSFQRRTLHSPPSLRESVAARTLSNDSSGNYIIDPRHQRTSPSVKSPLNYQEIEPAEKVQKLLAKLSSIGVGANVSYPTEELVKEVRKIFRNRMEDVEYAWEARIEALQQEVILRDATIRQLTDTITKLQNIIVVSSDGSDNASNQDGERDVEGELNLIEKTSESSYSSSDDDEPAFMRCDSVESIIHQSPEASQTDEEHARLTSRMSWPGILQKQKSLRQQRFCRSFDLNEPFKRKDIILDIGSSSTDDDLHSFSSDDDHYIYQREPMYISEEIEDEEDIENVFQNSLEEDEDELNRTRYVENGKRTDQELNSKDWEVQMLANKLADDQRGVAKKIDRDIASGKIQSSLADLHQALATDNLSNLTESDLLRLESIIRKEREKLRQYARMYSLDERPVLEDEFSSLYRSRSQMLLSKSSELCRAGTTDRRLLKLLAQLTSLPLEEQFLLDRLVYKADRKQRFSRQQSLCEDRLSSYNQARSLRINSFSNPAVKRSISMCSPPPDSRPLSRKTSFETCTEDPTMEVDLTGSNSEVSDNFPTQSIASVISSMQRSFTISENDSELTNDARDDKEYHLPAKASS